VELVSFCIYVLDKVYMANKNKKGPTI